MRRVLFVDDDPNILSGLRDMLRKHRKRWDMVFALGGPAALLELDKGAFDVVVSDMRMPIIDGAALLAQVRERYPGSVRIVLSGHAEREAVLRAVPVAHQFLSKPCDAAALQMVIERTCELQQKLQDEGIRGMVGSIDKLPTAPSIHSVLLEAAQADLSLEALTSLVERDPALSAKVLQLVNSAYFGAAKRLASISQAVAYLGTDLMKQLVLSGIAFGTTEVPPLDPALSIETVRCHALLSARIAARLANGPERAAEAFAAALLHDVGVLVLASGMSERYGAVLTEMRRTGEPQQDVEKRLLGVDHAEVGAYLLAFWGLPSSIVDATAYHYTPSLAPESSIDTLALVHIAVALADDVLHGGAPAPLDRPFLERTGYAERLPAFRAVAEEVRAEEDAG